MLLTYAGNALMAAFCGPSSKANVVFCSVKRATLYRGASKREAPLETWTSAASCCPLHFLHRQDLHSSCIRLNCRVKHPAEAAAHWHTFEREALLETLDEAWCGFLEKLEGLRAATDIRCPCLLII